MISISERTSRRLRKASEISVYVAAVLLLLLLLAGIGGAAYLFAYPASIPIVFPLSPGR